jgi:hypothetical protein
MVPDITKNVHRFARDETGINTANGGNGMVFTSALNLTFSPEEKE